MGFLGSGVLLNALNSGRPGKAAVDVFDEEPITWKQDELACHRRIIATPHIGFVTDDEFEMQFSQFSNRLGHGPVVAQSTC